MRVEDAIRLFGVIQSQNDGTEFGAERADYLINKLIEDPSDFWDIFWSTMNPPQERALALFAQIGPNATFADMQRAFEAEAVKIQRGGDVQ